MQRPGIAGVVVLCLFGLPFAAFGLIFAFTSGLAQANGRPDAWGGILFGIAFSCIGFGLMAAAIVGYRKLNQQADVEDANPDSPWLWRNDWAAGRADGNSPKASIFLWIVAGFWSAVSFPVSATVLPKMIAQHDPRALLLAVFPLIGVVLLVYAIRGTLRTMRYGRTSFQFAGATFTPGASVKGTLHLKLPTDLPHGFDLTLSCKRRIVTGSGKNRSVQVSVLWQDKKNVAAGAVMRGPVEAEVPVEFAVPADVCETNDDNPNDRVLWQLHAQADVPGVDFSDDYEIPVFRTQTSQAPSPASSAFAATDAASKGEAPVAAPESTHIVFRPDWDGPSFYFPPLRNHGQALGVVVFASIWSAVVYFLWHDARAPWFFRIAFSLAEVLVGYMMLTVVFGSALLRARAGVLEIRKSMLGMGRLRSIPFDQISSISPLSQGQANTSGEALYGITVESTGGKINVAANSLSLAEARWVVGTIEAAMGRKQDTRVEFQSAYGAPPQGRVWGSAAGGVVYPTGVPANVRKKQRILALAGFVIWLAFAAPFFRGVFGSLSRSGAFPANGARSSRAAHVTPADFDRIGALSPQQQAEDLIELSVRHDPRALAMFEDKIDSWTGQLQSTDRMKQVEARSRFSSDLRVRQANVDLNLALAGWHRDPAAVDALMKLAADAGSRPSAYYYLGMEGARGVDSDRVFAFLRERAHFDADPVARQWAVEGLRFFKSDEALDVMYRSFTSDDNYNVRDRAGCNVSDCGIFTRAQRVRYVPKLIELSADPTLTPQMRNWVFMALGEITDERVANDASAWRQWYAQHGAEKARQFAALPWYQVRGDE